jgi:prepilin-type N-terminal cleavage/methylation domain-containing protein
MSAVAKSGAKGAFTLIELLLVVVLIGIASMLVISHPPKITASKKITDLRKLLYPEGVYYLFKNGNSLLVHNDKNTTDVNIPVNFPQVYVYKNGQFVIKDLGYKDNNKIVFEYRMKNGIGNSFILETDNGFYVFKPFAIIKTDNFDEAKNIYLNSRYFPEEGDIY